MKKIYTINLLLYAFLFFGTAFFIAIKDMGGHEVLILLGFIAGVVLMLPLSNKIRIEDKCIVFSNFMMSKRVKFSEISGISSNNKRFLNLLSVDLKKDNGDSVSFPIFSFEDSSKILLAIYTKVEKIRRITVVKFIFEKIVEEQKISSGDFKIKNIRMLKKKEAFKKVVKNSLKMLSLILVLHMGWFVYFCFTSDAGFDPDILWIIIKSAVLFSLLLLPMLIQYDYLFKPDLFFD